MANVNSSQITTTTKIPQTKQELLTHLQEQLDFLKISADGYDAGITSEAKRMAVTLRVLLHDHGNSHSLLGQLGMKNRKFFDTSVREPKNYKRIGSYVGLVLINTPIDKEMFQPAYIPFLDEAVPGESRYTEFDTYWNETICIDGDNNEYSREDMVRTVADQDGGAHVDAGLTEKYSRLSRQNSMGWIIGDSNIPLKGIELALIRQIAHEVLRTLVSDYPFKKMNIRGGLGFGGIYVGTDPNAPQPNRYTNIGRNDHCPCGKTREDGTPVKYKRCCGR